MEMEWNDIRLKLHSTDSQRLHLCIDRFLVFWFRFFNRFRDPRIDVVASVLIQAVTDMYRWIVTPLVVILGLVEAASIVVVVRFSVVFLIIINQCIINNSLAKGGRKDTESCSEQGFNMVKVSQPSAIWRIHSVFTVTHGYI